MHVSLLNVVFQTINFLVLVFLLKRFLYGPILAVIAERKQKIQREQEATASEKREAEALKAEFVQKLAVFADEKQALRNQALAEAETEASAFRTAMELKFDSERARQNVLLENERTKVQKQLEQHALELGLLIAQKLLSSKAVETNPLEAVRFSLSQITALPQAEQDSVFSSVRQNGAELASVSPLENELVRLAEHELSRACGGTVSLACTVEPKLLWGLELRLGHLSFALHLSEALRKVKTELFPT